MKKIFTYTVMMLMAGMLSAQIIEVPGDYQTIREAIAAAASGDTIVVSDGIYYEQINFLGKKPLMLASRFLLDGDTNHIINTVIDGAYSENPDSLSLVYFISGEDTTSVICGFTIRNGKGTHCSTFNDTEGGGIWISGSGAMIKNNIITLNNIENTLLNSEIGCQGGGIGVDYADNTNWVVIMDNVIDHNSLTTQKSKGYCDGAGISAAHNTRIINNKITNNVSRREATSTSYFSGGGGICCYGDTGFAFKAVVTGNIISGNQLYGNLSEGAGACFGDMLLTFSDNIVTDNYVGSLGPVTNLGGGGIVAIRSHNGSVINNNRFENNYSASSSGAVNISSPSGWSKLVKVESNYFINNHADGWGGAFGSSDNPVVLMNNIFSHNSANYGGVGYIDCTMPLGGQHYSHLVNNTFSHNYAHFCSGGFDFNQSNPFIMNCVFWKNMASFGQEICIAAGYVEIAFSDIDTNEIIGTLYCGPGIINSDPLFADTLLLLPRSWSPVIDIGSDNYTCIHHNTFYKPDFDILGNPRPAGDGIDQGAYDQIWVAGLNEFTSSECKMIAYPNPFAGTFAIEYFSTASEPAYISVFNQLGEQVKFLVYSDKSEVIHKVYVSTDEWNAGIYYCTLRTGNQTAHAKLVKMK